MSLSDEETEDAAAFLPHAKVEHRERVTVHVPQVRRFLGVRPSGTAILGEVVWEGVAVRSRSAARRAAFMAWVDGAHLDEEPTAEEPAA